MTCDRRCVQLKGLNGFYGLKGRNGEWERGRNHACSDLLGEKKPEARSRKLRICKWLFRLNHKAPFLEKQIVNTIECFAV